MEPCLVLLQTVLLLFLRIGWARARVEVLRMCFWNVLQSFKTVWDVCWHGDIYVSIIVVPLEGKTTVVLALSVRGEFIVFH